MCQKSLIHIITQDILHTEPFILYSIRERPINKEESRRHLAGRPYKKMHPLQKIKYKETNGKFSISIWMITGSQPTYNKYSRR